MTGSDETLATSEAIMWLWDWSPDGSYLVYNFAGALWQLPLAPRDGKRTPIKLTTGPDDEQYGQVSPDGRWLAYAGGQRAIMQVFVQPMPPTGAMWLVSKDGGTMPRWRADGKELYYRAADGRLMAVPINTGSGSSFQNGTPQPLFGSLPIAGTLNRFTYAPSPDGQRFLVTMPLESAATPMTVLLNRLQGARQ
jgi:Tol biopolymer transport system component